MKQLGFIDWLQLKEYNESTINSRIANCLRVEEYEGDLDYHYNEDHMVDLMKRLTYTSDDMANSNPTKHRIPINGDIRNGTATLKSAVKLYLNYLNDDKNGIVPEIREVRAMKLDVVDSHDYRDSYERFINRFNITREELFEFGLSETIMPEMELVEEKWEDLKRRLFSNEEVCIRGAGRDAKGTQIHLDFYENIFGNRNIVKDPTNNLRPQKIIQELTGYQRNKNLFNYQVSHIFGKTKNPLLFEAPWNIALVPKIVDPFTGHETKGSWPVEYQSLFLKMSTEKYSSYIRDYNSIIRSLEIDSKLTRFLVEAKTKYSQNEILQFTIGINKELSEII